MENRISICLWLSNLALLGQLFALNLVIPFHRFPDIDSSLTPCPVGRNGTSAYLFWPQTTLLFRKDLPPRSRPVPGMVVALAMSSKHKGIPTFVPRLDVTFTFFKSHPRAGGKYTSLVPSSFVFPPVFVNQTAFVNHNESFEPDVLWLLFRRFLDVCHSILLAPRRYA